MDSITVKQIQEMVSSVEEYAQLKSKTQQGWSLEITCKGSEIYITEKATRRIRK